MDITLVRAKAFAMFPYMSTMLAMLKMVPTPGLGTMGVSPKGRVFYDPDILDTWGLETSASVLAHEAWHLLRGHAARAGDRDPKTWNIACDIAINDDAVLRKHLPATACFPEGYRAQGVRANMLEEDIYDALMATPPTPPAPPPPSPGDGGKDPAGDSAPPDGGTDPDDSGDGADGGKDPAPAPTPTAPAPASKAAQDAKGGPASGACGSGAGGEPMPCEGDEDDGPMGSDIERELVSRQVAHAAQSCGKAGGNVQRWARETLAPPTVSWRQLLRAALRAAIRTSKGAHDYRYQRPRMRSGVLLPSMTQPRLPIAVVLDTSGSVDDAMLAACSAEIDGILKASHMPCTVLPCDAQVHAVQRITSATAINPIGGGGTDMGVGIAACEALRPRHGAIVVLTDGYTPWPKEAPSIRTIVCLIGNIAESTVPAWATTVRINTK